jgi:DNA integrity scanning protein DisA with diadenylate cyclase activity
MVRGTGGHWLSETDAVVVIVSEETGAILCPQGAASPGT